MNEHKMTLFNRPNRQNSSVYKNRISFEKRYHGTMSDNSNVFHFENWPSILSHKTFIARDD